MFPLYKSRDVITLTSAFVSMACVSFRPLNSDVSRLNKILVIGGFFIGEVVCRVLLVYFYCQRYSLRFNCFNDMEFCSWFVIIFLSTPYIRIVKGGQQMWPLILLWDMGFSGIIIQVVLGLMSLDLFFRIFRRKVYYVKVHDFTKGHSWCSISNSELVLLLNFHFFRFLSIPNLCNLIGSSL